MMKKTRWLISILLCAVLLALPVMPAGAAENTARLYNVYGDHMLFQQNEDAVFAGEASPGAAIAVTLQNAAGETVRSAAGTAKEDGTFSVSFPAPAGSFDPYTVVLTENGVAFRTLTDVVFGELWLSFGQSNMEFSLIGTPEGQQMLSEGKTGRDGVRFLSIPHKTKDGALFADATPQTDAPGCFWFPATSEAVFGMSAVAYAFADAMLDLLGVPVGILNAAVGGSAIGAWIPRTAIEANEGALAAFQAHNAYLTPEQWNSGTRNYYCDMAGLYNSKIAPLQNFRLAGGIWYQGESEIFLYNDPYYYHAQFNLMQDTYTALFSHDDGRLPLVDSQLVSYNYGLGPYGETKFNEVFTVLAAEDPASRSEIVVSDILPLYAPETGSIHPILKKAIGARMAASAYTLVYDGAAPASSPYRSGMRTQDGSVYVTFANVGNGLLCSGDTLRGFSVYGDDGVCVGAQAEIVAPDTVRVYSDAVPDPKGAAYAVNSLSLGANLYSSFDGVLYLPAAAFGSNDAGITKLFDDAEWLTCDTLTAWQNSADAPGFFDAWVGQNAALSVSDDRVQGTGSLKIQGEGKRFSASAVLYEKRSGKKTVYDSLDGDFSKYGTLSLSFKNTGAAAVTLEGVRLYGQGETFYTPLCNESGKNGVVIPADGSWHTYTFNLNALGLSGSSVGRWNNDTLTDVTEVRLCFSGKDATVQCDDIRFAPEGDGAKAPFLQRVVLFFRSLVERIKLLFERIKGFFA